MAACLPRRAVLPGLSCLLRLPAVVLAQAVDVAGVRFEPQVMLGGQALLLNGAGIPMAKIWLGKSPADQQPKDALLGQAPRRSDGQ